MRHRSWLEIMAVGLLVIVGLTAGAARAEEPDEAQARFFRSSVAAERALESALAEAAPEARPRLEQALTEVRASREETVRALVQASVASGAQGRVRALEAVARGTQTHLDVLGRVYDAVPEAARPGIDRALAVSRTGGDTAVGAIGGERPTSQDTIRRRGLPSDARQVPPPAVRSAPASRPPAPSRGAVPGRDSEGLRGSPDVRGGPPGGVRGR